MSAPSLPLDGFTVVTVEHAVAAPVASRHLADLGARVIKVERPDGGDFARGYDEKVRGLSSWFVWANRGKESVALDLKDSVGREALRRLIAGADVFLHNLRPSAAERLGIDADTLRGQHRRLVVCEISGFGAGGPMADAKAYDLLMQAEVGLLEVTGTPDTRAKAGISIADIAAAMYAYSGILGALLGRSRTGEGAAVRVSMIDALAEWMSAPIYFAHYGGAAPARSGARHAMIAPYGPFPTGDDNIVMLGVQNEREWTRFCASVLGRPELATDGRFDSNSGRIENVDELESQITEAFSDLTAVEVVDRLHHADIAFAQVNDLAEVWSHQQLRARHRFATIGSPVGDIEVLRPPAEPAGGARLGAVPALGEHTEAVLAELGLAADQVDTAAD